MWNLLIGRQILGGLYFFTTGPQDTHKPNPEGTEVSLPGGGHHDDRTQENERFSWCTYQPKSFRKVTLNETAPFSTPGHSPLKGPKFACRLVSHCQLSDGWIGKTYTRISPRSPAFYYELVQTHSKVELYVKHPSTHHLDSIIINTSFTRLSLLYHIFNHLTFWRISK